MEINGKIIKILPSASGVSKRTGNQWVSYSFVIETNEQYPKKVCLSVFGEEKWTNFGIKEGGTYNVRFDIDAHEYNGRWFNELNVWGVSRLDAAQGKDNKPAQKPAPAVEAPVASGAEQGGESSDLPF